MNQYRIERDSMGEVKVPKAALYAAQTQRAIENFTIPGPVFPASFIRALGLLKASAASANKKLGTLDAGIADAISEAALGISRGMHLEQFPLVIYQTGSGTSTNMNANEVIAALASEKLGSRVHPNDHVNMSQSSNDVIPSAIHVSAYLEVKCELLPALGHLEAALRRRAEETKDVVKTGRTHLMDAMPMTMGQEIGGWAAQVALAAERIESVMPRLARLAIGGTAVGTGVNAHPKFGSEVCAELKSITGVEFMEAQDHFSAQASMDTATELSGSLKASATALMKIANDLRHLNSGPLAGLGEIALPALQPGSSIMPGKVNPVIPEAVMMASARVMGNDVTAGIANSLGNFQLNVMLPLIAHSLLESIGLLAGSALLLADKAVAGFTVNRSRIEEALEKNPVIVTALSPAIGYDRAAEIAKRAYAEGRKVRDVAREMSGLSEAELERLLDPGKMTGQG